MDDPPVKRISLGGVLGRFKSLTTHRYLDGVRISNWRGCEGRLWQRNYYEHVIRDEIDYQAIFNDIIVNHQNWEKDDEFAS